MMRHANIYRLTIALALIIGLIPAALVQAQDCEPIVVAVWSSPEHENLVATSQVYMEATGCEVIIEEIAREAYFNKLTTTLLAGGSDYDVMYAMTDNIPEWVAAETLQPLDVFFNDSNVVGDIFSLDNLSPTIDTLSVDGVPYGFPSEGDTAWLFYRKDLLEAAGLEVPQTWDEFLTAAQTLRTDDVYGAVIGAKPDEAVWDFMHYLFGFGGGILDENYNVIVNNEAGVAALSFYAGLATEYNLVPPDVVTYGYNEILTTLQEGKAALGIEWMAATQDLQNCELSPAVCIDGEPQLHYALVPGIAMEDGTIQRGQGASQWGWVIPAAAENKTEAYKFIEWLTSVEGASIWALNGGIPSNNAALAAPEVVAVVPQFELLAQAMPYRNLFPSTTVTPTMVNAFNDAVNSAVAGVKEPQEALDEAAAIMHDALVESGYLSE